MVGIVGRQNVGKTTFLVRLVPALHARGLRVCVIKHGPHGFEIDRPGKDTYAIRRTGVAQTLIVGGELLAVVEKVEREPPLEEVVARHVRDDVDLIVCEGYKREPHPRIEVARAAVSRELVLSDADLLAVVADFAPQTSRPVYAPDDADGVAELIAREVVGDARSFRPQRPRLWSSATPVTVPARPAAAGPMPELAALEGVVAVGRSETVGASTLTLLSLERYDDGFVVELRIRYEREASGPVPSMPRPEVSASDALGTAYRSWPHGGSGGGGRGRYEWRYALKFAPAIPKAAREVRVEVRAVEWLRHDAERRELVPEATERGPWTFAVPLA